MRYKLFFKLAFLLFFTLLNKKSFSQKVKIALEIKNGKNYSVSYASLTLLNEKKNFVCNLNGKFEGFADLQDSILISSVGFLDSIFYIKQLLNNPIVNLRQRVNLMKEVVIKNGKKLSLGNLNLKEDRSIIGGDSSSPSFEIVKLIKTKGVYNEFKVLTVSFKQKQFYSTVPLLVHIYSVNNYGLPGDELLIDSPFLVMSDMYHDGIITIDVRSANIILNNEDFFIGLQFLHPFDKKLIDKKWGFGMDPGIFETKKEHEQLTYRRSNHFKKCWYAEYNNGFIFPKQNQFDEKKYIENPSNSNLKPINLIAGVEIELFN
jgi:hypothetical protein